MVVSKIVIFYMKYKLQKSVVLRWYRFWQTKHFILGNGETMNHTNFVANIVAFSMKACEVWEKNYSTLKKLYRGINFKHCYLVAK